MDGSTFKSVKRKQLKLKKRNLKKGKSKMEKSDGGKQATAAEEAGQSLIISKKKRREEVFQGELDGTKKMRIVTVSQDDLDSTKKKKKMKTMKMEKKGKGESKKSVRQGKRESKGEESTENIFNAENDTVEEICSVDEDCSRGMKKWILDYHQGRPGLEIVQQRLGEFIAEYEAEQEKARKEREALAAEGGWTVVVHHKGRKKTTDSESGIAVGSVAQAAVEDKMSKKKQKELALDFYRFQKREAQRNEVMMLQSKFEQDKKRLQQLRAARKFRPY